MRPFEPGVPLAHYLTHQDCGVRFTCESCQHSTDVPVARVIARLKARGLGGEATGICEVARHAERPCASCGAMRWTTRPAFRLPENRP